MAKRSSDSWVAYPEVKVHVRDLVQVVDIVASFAPRGSVFGENLLYRQTRSTRGGRHVVKRSSDFRVAFAEVKLQVRDLVRVVGIVANFAPRGSVFGENSLYRALGDKWAQETCAGCPKQQYAMGEPGKVQGRDRVCIVERSCGCRTIYDQCSGKFVLSRNPVYMIRGVAMWLNIVLTHE